MIQRGAGTARANAGGVTAHGEKVNPSAERKNAAAWGFVLQWPADQTSLSGCIAGVVAD